MSTDLIMPNLYKILLLCVFFCTGSIPANAIEPLVNDPTKEILACKLTGNRSKDMGFQSGWYLEEHYLNKLLEVRSHIVAFLTTQENSPQTIFIGHNGNEFSFANGFNWHEGGVTFAGTRSEWEKLLKNNDYQIIDKCHLNGYVFVGKSDSDFITHIVLVGTYVDDKGRRYIFDAHKKATFPDHAFYYELMLDRVLDPNEQDDFLLVADKKTGLQLKPEEQGKFIAFRHDGNDVILYPTRPVSEGLGYAIADHDHPIARLHKISN